MKMMITNGGAHPADKWAEMTADTIVDLIQVGADSDTPEAATARQAKRDMRPKLFDIFNEHHGAIQTKERATPIALKAKLDPTPHVDPTLAKVNIVLAATPFAEHFGKPEVQAVLTSIVAQHSADVMHIERRYHADRAAGKAN